MGNKKLFRSFRSSRPSDNNDKNGRPERTQTKRRTSNATSPAKNKRGEGSDPRSKQGSSGAGQPFPPLSARHRRQTSDGSKKKPAGLHQAHTSPVHSKPNQTKRDSGQPERIKSTRSAKAARHGNNAGQARTDVNSHKDSPSDESANVPPTTPASAGQDSVASEATPSSETDVPDIPAKYVLPTHGSSQGELNTAVTSEDEVRAPEKAGSVGDAKDVDRSADSERDDMNAGAANVVADPDTDEQPIDIDEAIKVADQTARNKSVSLSDLFRDATEYDYFGLPGLRIPKESSQKVEVALAQLGTPVPVIRHVAEVARVSRKGWVATARSLGTPPGERLSRALSMAAGLPFFSRNMVDDVDDVHLREHLPRGLKAGRLTGLPVAQHGNELLCAIPDSQSRSMLKTAYFESNMELKFCIASPSTIEQIYRRKFANTEAPFDEALQHPDRPQEIVATLLIHAAAVGASDIHLEPRIDHGAIFLRIDGVRETFRIVDLLRRGHSNTTDGTVSGTYGAIINLIFNQCGKNDIDMSEEGDIDSLIPDQLRGRYDFRLQLTRSIYGIRAVIRLLDQSGDVGEMEDLGIDEITKRGLEKIIHSDSGMLLFVGPTGSGKSTTQAALLKTINAVQNSVQTIENPVETRSGMWVQHPLSRRSDRDEGTLQKVMAKGLLRADPEVVQVQELRDADNTMVAAEAANTGHLVFATLHANSAAFAIVRMRSMRSATTGEALDMSVITPVLKGIMAQRLVRRICPKCREEDHREETYTSLSKCFDDTPTVYAASAGGCEFCRFTGYAGRMLIYELLTFDMEFAEQIQEGLSVNRITERIPIERRMIGRGYQLVKDGKTTIDEIHRVVSEG